MSIRSNPGQSENVFNAAYGLAFCVLGRAESVLMARGAGFDFVVADMEHGPIGLGELGQMAAAGIAAGLPLYGRVTGPDSPDIARVLDCGATGVIVPHVDSAADAQRIAQACRFGPRGARALPGPLPMLDYRVVPASELVDGVERNVEVVAMIESAPALDAVDQIAATPGIDMLMIGTNDLADGIGLRGQIDHPDLRAAFQRIAGAAAAHCCGFGVMGLPEALVESHALALGARAIVATNETNLITEGGAAQLARLKAKATR